MKDVDLRTSFLEMIQLAGHGLNKPAEHIKNHYQINASREH